MKILDTDIITLLLQGHAKVVDRRRRETALVAISVVSRIEVFQGRFASLLKAATGDDLKRGQQRLDNAERDLRPFPIANVTDGVAAEFDRLRQGGKTRRTERHAHRRNRRGPSSYISDTQCVALPVGSRFAD